MTDALLDLEYPSRAEAAVLDVCDAHGAVLGRTKATGGVLRLDLRATRPRTLTGLQIDEADADGINPYSDWLRPVWQLSDGREFAMGLLAFVADPVKSSATGSDVHSPTLHDGSVYLDVPALYTIGGAMGDLVTGVIERLIEAAGVPSYRVAPSTVTLLAPNVFPSGKTYLSSITTLCGLVGYAPPIFDRDGMLRAEAAPALTQPADVTYTLARVLDGTRSTNPNLLDAPNAHQVIDTSPTAVPISAIAYVDSGAPNSRENRGGRVIPQIHRVQGIESQAAAQVMADNFAANDPLSLVQVSFDGPADPRHDVLQIVRVNGIKYREVSWSQAWTAGGVMNHTLTRATIGAGDE